jgi:hypothetical protein
MMIMKQVRFKKSVLSMCLLFVNIISFLKIRIFNRHNKKYCIYYKKYLVDQKDKYQNNL